MDRRYLWRVNRANSKWLEHRKTSVNRSIPSRMIKVDSWLFALNFKRKWVPFSFIISFSRTSSLQRDAVRWLSCFYDDGDDLSPIMSKTELTSFTCASKRSSFEKHTDKVWGGDTCDKTTDSIDIESDGKTWRDNSIHWKDDAGIVYLFSVDRWVAIKL